MGPRRPPFFFFFLFLFFFFFCLSCACSSAPHKPRVPWFIVIAIGSTIPCVVRDASTDHTSSSAEHDNRAKYAGLRTSSCLPRASPPQPIFWSILKPTPPVILCSLKLCSRTCTVLCRGGR